MTLRQLLSALKTVGVKVELLDLERNEIIKFYSEGYAGVEEDILAREVKQFEFPSTGTMTIVIKDAVETTNETNETNAETNETTEP